MELTGEARRDVFRGFGYALGGTILSSTNYVAVKYGLNGFNLESYSLVNTSAATIFALVIVIAGGHWRHIALPVRASSQMVFIGLATGTGMLLSYAGVEQLDPTFAAFLWRFLPVMTILLGVVLLGEHVSREAVAALTVMVAGGLFGAFGRWNVVGLGMTLTLLACGAFAVQMLIGKIVTTDVHPDIVVLYRIGIGTLIIASWGVRTGNLVFDAGLGYWMAAVLGALLGPCMSYLLFFRSYRHWRLSQTGMVLTAQPLFTLVWASLLLRQVPTPRELGGGLMILMGAVWLAGTHLRRKT